MTRFHLVPALLVLAGATSAQTVHVVDAAGGPGSSFTDLQPALDAAADGDILLVRAGSYSGAEVTGKALDVVADVDAAVRVDGTLRVVGVPPGTTFTLKGLEIVGLDGAGQNGLEADLCAGSLWIESVHATGSKAGMDFARDGAWITQCDDVVVVRSVFRGGLKGSFPRHEGAEGLTASASALWAFESEFRGTSGGWHDEIGGSGRAGALLVGDSDLFATACTFEGGDGGGADDDFDIFCECIVCGFTGSGGNGLELHGGQATIQASSFSFGQGGISTSIKGCPDGTDGVNILQAGGASVVQLAGPTRGLRQTPVVREGEVAQLAAVGAPGELVWWLLALDGQSLYLPGKNSPLLLELPLLLSLPLAPVPAGGLLTLGFPAPTLPGGLEGVVLRGQAFFAAPGSGQLSNSASTLFLDGSL